MSILLIRHGEPVKAFGIEDPSLSELGINQARNVVLEILDLFSIKPIQVVASPRLRTQETAVEISRLLKIPMSLDNAFSEIPIQADTSDEKREKVKKFFDSSWEEVSSELLSWKKQLISQLKRIPDQSIVVTHFGVINTILSDVMDSQKTLVFRPEYCSISEILIQKNHISVIKFGKSKSRKY